MEDNQDQTERNDLAKPESAISDNAPNPEQHGAGKNRERKIKYIALIFGILVALILGEIIMRVYYNFYSKDVIGADEEERCNRRQYKDLLDTNELGRYHP